MTIESLSELKKEFSSLSSYDKTIYRERLYLIFYILGKYHKEVLDEARVILDDSNYDLDVLNHVIETYRIYDLRTFILYGGIYDIDWLKYREAKTHASEMLKQDYEDSL